MAPLGTTPVEGITDSKKLSPKRREALHDALCKAQDVHIAIGMRSASHINEYGIQRALRQSFLEAIEELLALGLPLDSIRADGKPLWPESYFDTPTQFIIGGDGSDWAIGAASIAAKVRRDAYMAEQAKRHPQYGWERNAGYGTKEHIAAIREHGLTPLHRVKFCRNFVSELHPPGGPPEEDAGAEDLIMELFGQ